MNTSDVLNKAADLIEERGWITGPSGWIVEGGGGLCLEGGLYAAMGSEFGMRHELESCPAYRAVEAYLGADHLMGLWQWNDDEDRTAEQVIATLRAAAVIEAAKENAKVEVSA